LGLIKGTRKQLMMIRKREGIEVQPNESTLKMTMAKHMKKLEVFSGGSEEFFIFLLSLKDYLEAKAKNDAEKI
jgi:hypothetical protein